MTMVDTPTIEPEVGLQPRPSPLREAPVWQRIGEGWRPLFGSFYDLGVSVEWHDFQLVSDFEWSRSFHPASLELCLNLSGKARVRCGHDLLDFESNTAGFYTLENGKAALEARREARQQHRFVTIEFSSRFLREQLTSCDGALHPLVETMIARDNPCSGFSAIRRLNAAQEQLIEHLVHPPVAQAARPLWYRSKVLELMVEFFFERRGEDELFCDRQKRLARERTDRVIAILRRDLASPPELEQIGREVGCSPFHLSRTFSKLVGMTMPQYLRKLRMQRAAELLESGKCNVTEAALEVGYSSLSHFSQAFCQIIGKCPGLYPSKAQPEKPSIALNGSP